jgi:hypothetical protein
MKLFLSKAGGKSLSSIHLLRFFLYKKNCNLDIKFSILCFMMLTYESVLAPPIEAQKENFVLHARVFLLLPPSSSPSLPLPCTHWQKCLILPPEALIRPMHEH